MFKVGYIQCRKLGRLKDGNDGFWSALMLKNSNDASFRSAVMLKNSNDAWFWSALMLKKGNDA